MDESCRNLLKPALKIPQEQGLSLSKNENKKMQVERDKKD